MKIINRADGVYGHYCIGRKVRKGEPFWEYYNPHAKGEWASFCKVFITKKSAILKKKQLKGISHENKTGF